METTNTHFLYLCWTVYVEKGTPVAIELLIIRCGGRYYTQQVMQASNFIELCAAHQGSGTIALSGLTLFRFLSWLLFGTVASRVSKS